MKYNPDIHHRQSVRIKGYDYTQVGGYFITIVIQNRECLLGNISNGEIILNEYGKIIADFWEWLEQQYGYVNLDEWVIMPNHLHGIIILTDNNCCRGGSRTTPTRKPIGRLIGAFKTVSSKFINEIRQTPGARLWQRNYYEHIIRNECELHSIRNYIINNPINWESDDENTINILL